MPEEGMKPRSFGYIEALCQARPKKRTSIDIANYEEKEKVKNPEESINMTNEGK
jgi:hypothetical protein